MKLDRTQIAGLVLVVVVLALGVGAGVAIAELPAPSGDILSFAGALIGAAIAVIGAVYVFEHQRLQTAAEARKVLSELLEDVQAKAAKVRQPDPDPNPEHTPALVMISNVDWLIEAVDSVKRAMQWYPPASPGMVRAYVQIERLSIDKEAIVNELRPNLFYGGIPNLDQHLNMFEIRVNLALAELRR